MTNHHFHAMFPAPTYAELLQVETHLKSLACLNLQALRMANNPFHAMDPAATHAELLAQVETHLKFYTSLACTRLRPATVFTLEMITGS
jgi:hypothetical protein